MKIILALTICLITFTFASGQKKRDLVRVEPLTAQEQTALKQAIDTIEAAQQKFLELQTSIRARHGQKQQIWMESGSGTEVIIDGKFALIYEWSECYICKYSGNLLK
jgi:hypothetical protein